MRTLERGPKPDMSSEFRDAISDRRSRYHLASSRELRQSAPSYTPGRTTLPRNLCATQWWTVNGRFCHAKEVWTVPLGGTSGVFLTVDILSVSGRAVGAEVCKLWFGSEVTEARKSERIPGPTAKRPSGGSAREGLSLGSSRLRTV